jgi:hypothetical protein
MGTVSQRVVLHFLAVILIGSAAYYGRAETLVALTSSSDLLIFDSTSPGTIFSRTPITGLLVGESLVGIDLRPATGDLYGLSNQNRLYTIDPITAAATLKAALSPVAGDPFTGLSGTDFGIDFNPVVDRLRVVSNTGQNLRINPNSGVVTTDAALAYAAGEAHFGEAPNIVDIAYVNNVDTANTTTLFGLDATLNITVRQGGPDGNPSPNTGQLFVAGKFGKQGAVPKGFEITPAGVAYVATKLNFPTGSSPVYELVKIDLAGGDESQGFIGDGNIPIEDLAALPAIQFSAASYAVNKSAGTATITVTRGGPGFGTATVTYASIDDTAKAGIDYQAVAGTLSFAAKATSKTFDVPIINTATANDDLFINLVLSNPTGVALGRKAATLRINRSHPGEKTGPQVLKLGMTGPSRGISGMVVTFDRDLDPAKAVALTNYSLRAVGKGTKSDVVFASAVYDPVARNVTLAATQTFEQTQFKTLQVKVNGKKDGIADLNNIPLGSKNGKSGTDAKFTFKIVTGETVTIKDTDGDVATITVANGGHLDGILLAGRKFLFQAWILDPIALSTTVSGTVTKKPKGDGIVVISEIIGLDKKEFTPLLINPSFRVNTLTFSSNATGR